MPAGAAPGERRGGRQKGTPNKPKQALIEMMAERWPGYHPVMAMADIANDDSVDLETRFAAHREVAQYVEPKRKAVEHTGPDGGPVQVAWPLPRTPLDGL